MPGFTRCSAAKKRMTIEQQRDMQLSELVCKGHKPRAAHRLQQRLRRRRACWPPLHCCRTPLAQSSGRWLPAPLKLGQDKTRRDEATAATSRKEKMKMIPDAKAGKGLDAAGWKTESKFTTVTAVKPMGWAVTMTGAGAGAAAVAADCSIEIFLAASFSAILLFFSSSSWSRALISSNSDKRGVA